MREFSKGFRIFSFIFKISLGIFDEVSDIVYYNNQTFQFIQLKNSMLFFLILSPAIQTIAWSILLAQIKLEIPKPIKSDRVKQSQSFIRFLINFCISFIEYHAKLLIIMIKFIPQSLGITILQELKIFPFCLFGYTYFKYQAILTRDLMKNLAPHLFLFKRIEEAEKDQMMKQISVQEKNKQGFQISPNVSQNNCSKSINQSVDQNTPKKIINLKQMFLQSQNADDKSESSQQQIHHLDQSKESQTQIECIDAKNLQNPLLQKSQISNDQQSLSQFNKHAVKKVSKMNQLQRSLTKNSNEGLEIMKNNFGNSVLLFQNQFKRESIQIQDRRKQSSLLKRKNMLQSTAFYENKDENIENYQQNQDNQRNREYSMRKKLFGYDKPVLNITQILKQNNLQDNNRRSRISITKRETQTIIMPGVVAANMNAINQINNNQDTESDETNKIFNETDLLLDANIVPTIETLVQDYNLEQFLLITDIIEAIFEAIPMTVIQYINNGINNSWINPDGTYNIFIYFSFFTSLFTIIVHGIQLINILYNDNIKTFYFTLQFLEKYKKTREDEAYKSEEESETIKQDGTSPSEQKQKTKKSKNIYLLFF